MTGREVQKDMSLEGVVYQSCEAHGKQGMGRGDGTHSGARAEL